jgi:hypothetical protein
MKRKKQRNYYRTTALLGAQPHVATKHKARRSIRRFLREIPWQWVALLVVVLALALWMWLGNRWYVMGEDLEVMNASSNTLAYDVALASDLLGWHAFWLDTDAAAAQILAAVPGVTTAEVACRRFPAHCTIHVSEREPVLIWESEAGVKWVDAEGVVFPARFRDETSDAIITEQRPSSRAELPIVHGPLPALKDGRIPEDILTGVRALIDLGIPSDRLGYLPARGLIWVDEEGRRVAFGTGPDMDARWAIYQALIEDLAERKIFPWTVDVRFSAAPTYSMERAW